MRRQIEKITRAQKRIRRKTPGADLLRQLLDAQITKLSRSIDDAEDGFNHNGLVLAFLDDYENVAGPWASPSMTHVQFLQFTQAERYAEWTKPT